MATKTLTATVKHTTPIKGTVLTRTTPNLTINLEELPPSVVSTFNKTIPTMDVVYFSNAYYDDWAEWYWEFRISIDSNDIPNLSTGVNIVSISYLNNGNEANGWQNGQGGERTASARLSINTGGTYPSKFWLSIGSGGIIYTHDGDGLYTGGNYREPLNTAIQGAYQNGNPISLTISTTALW